MTIIDKQLSVRQLITLVGQCQQTESFVNNVALNPTSIYLTSADLSCTYKQISYIDANKFLEELYKLLYNP